MFLKADSLLGTTDKKNPGGTDHGVWEKYKNRPQDRRPLTLISCVRSHTGDTRGNHVLETPVSPSDDVPVEQGTSRQLRHTNRKAENRQNQYNRYGCLKRCRRQQY